MRSALIGYTGFVGSNLNLQRDFTSCYNSKNFTDMAKQTYDFVICAGIPAVKWYANKNPDIDMAQIDGLKRVLQTIGAEKFVLISTVDVYPTLKQVDEAYDCTLEPNHPYGRHRLEFEEFCRDKFSATVLRLPGLFGSGLKKNVIYDLLNDNLLDNINLDSSFQYYDLKHLSDDIEVAIANKLDLLNVTSEPIKTLEIANQFFADKVIGRAAGPELHYDVRSRHSNLWGKDSGYLYSKDEVLRDLEVFVNECKGGVS